MSKLIVSAKSKDHLLKLLKKDIDGVIIYLEGLSVNSDFYLGIEDVKKIDMNNKEVFLCMNKIMHNKDLSEVRRVLGIIQGMDVRVLFYDMGVYNIALEYGIVDKLVIYQDHANTSILTNNFYQGLGIGGSFISNDITMEELLDIKKNSKGDIMFLGYGYQPIFYSRRYLINNYLEYVDEYSGKEYRIISDNGVGYPISEEDEGTTIYSPRVINLINYMDKLEDIDYIVMNSVIGKIEEFDEMVDKFIKREKIDDDTYLGFLNVKTIYKLK